MLSVQKAKDGAEALNDPDETLNWMIELMDKTLQRVDTAVDEGTREVEKLHPPTFWSSQVIRLTTINAAGCQGNNFDSIGYVD